MSERPKATALPDFASMTPQEGAQWVFEHDLSDLGPFPSFEGTFVQVGEDNLPLLKVVTVKMPHEMVTRLDEMAGRDREGRSGVIRQAVLEWFERHPVDQQSEAA